MPRQTPEELGLEPFIGEAVIANPLTPLDIPEHPLLDNGGDSRVHNDHYNSASYPRSGPAGPAIDVTTSKLGSVTGVCAMMTMLKNGYVVGSCLVSDGGAGVNVMLLMFDNLTLDIVAEQNVGLRPFVANSAGGAYFSLDADENILIGPATNKLEQYHIEVIDGEPQFVLDYSKEIPGLPPAQEATDPMLQDTLLDYDGRLWFMVTDGRVGYYDIDADVIEMTDLERELENSLVVDDRGVYLVTVGAAVRVSAANDGSVRVDREAEYDAGEGTGLLPGSGGGPTLEDEDMVNLAGNPLELDEDWEAFAVCQKVLDNHPEWLKQLPLPQTPTLQIARRHTHCDWSVERPAEIHIERLGTEGVPSAPLDPAIMTKQIEQGTALFQTQGPFWPAFVDSIKGALPVNTATPWQPTGGLGITSQYNTFMWFAQGDDPEAAVIIRLPDTDIAKYMGLQLSNFWGSSADWANRQVSMNWGLDGGCQAEQSAATFHPAQQAILDAGGEFCGQQDAYFIVLSAADPGAKNWIETAELSEGLLAGRLQSVDAPIQKVAGITCNLPVAIPVPGPDAFPIPTNLATRVQIVLGQLGATATPAGPQFREDTLKVRQSFVRDKYIFW